MIGLILIHESTDYKTYVGKGVFAQMWLSEDLTREARAGMFYLWEKIKSTKNQNRAKNIEFGLIVDYANTILRDGYPFLTLKMLVFTNQAMTAELFTEYAEEILCEMADMKYPSRGKLTKEIADKFDTPDDKSIEILKATFESFISECPSVRKSDLKTLDAFLETYPTARLITMMEFNEYPGAISANTFEKIVTAADLEDMKTEWMDKYNCSFDEKDFTYLILDKSASRYDVTAKVITDCPIVLEIAVANYIKSRGINTTNIPDMLLKIVTDKPVYLGFTAEKKTETLTTFVDKWAVRFKDDKENLLVEMLSDIEAHVDGTVASFDDYVDLSEEFDFTE